MIIDVEQGSPEWLLSRLGKVTASNVSKLIGAQGKPSAQADGYINELISQRLTEELPETFKSSAMERGNELEDNARSMYELMTGETVEQCGFWLHDDLPVGFSPDGLIGDSGGLEIKCPLPNTHVAYMRSGKLPAQYKPQVMMSLWVSGRQWWDFMSYHPKMEPLLIRVERDEEYIEKLAHEVQKAADTIDKEVERLAPTAEETP